MGRKSPLVTIDDKTKTLVEWCREFNVFTTAVYRKISLGYTPQEAILSSRSKKVGMPKNSQTPTCQAPDCPKCGSSKTIWNGGSNDNKGKRISRIFCSGCKKTSRIQLPPFKEGS
jgi:hypothetical protein